MKKKKNQIDLHGFRVEDVVDELDQFIHRSVQSKLSRVSVMTGKGSGKVKKEAIKYLKLGGFPWSYEKDSKGKPNEGVLVVFLD